MSRIDLDARDRRLVDDARQVRAENEPAARPADDDAAKEWQADRVGKLLAAIDTLLRVIDGGAS